MANIIQNQQKAMQNKPATPAIGALLSTMLDSNKMRSRFEELLGKRTPQFISALTTMVTGDKNLQQAFVDSPMTVITAALKAASFDLPIEPSMGYAYIVPFNKKQDDGSYKKEAQLILGYKGMVQLCLRTGLYSRIPDAVDVREGELVSYNRLTGDAEFAWVEDEVERDKLPIIGYAGYFRLKNGAEKTLYMSKAQIEAHERKNRKGQYQSNLWKNDFSSMAMKTVIRRLISRYGIMSIEYHNAGDGETVSLAQQLADEENPGVIDAEPVPESDPATGEVVENAN